MTTEYNEDSIPKRLRTMLKERMANEKFPEGVTVYKAGSIPERPTKPYVVITAYATLAEARRQALAAYLSGAVGFIRL